jgi:hypothetical protein
MVAPWLVTMGATPGLTPMIVLPGKSLFKEAAISGRIPTTGTFRIWLRPACLRVMRCGGGAKYGVCLMGLGEGEEPWLPKK